MKYSYKSAQSMNLRPNHGVDNSSIGTLGANVIGSGDELFIATVDSAIQKIGDKWLKVETGGSIVGWVAVIHLGKVYGTLTENVVVPPPADVTYPAAISLTPLDADGNPIGEPKIYRA